MNDSDSQPSLTQRLHPGDIIVFSISASGTAAEYNKPLVKTSLQSTYPRYLGIVKSSIITPSPSVVEGYASDTAPKDVEQLSIAYIGRTPPKNSMIETQALIKFLPDQSLAFACIPIHQADSTSHSVEPQLLQRPPLRVVGDGLLPLPLGFVYTSFAVSAHLGSIHTGETSLRLDEGESYRLADCGSIDTTIIGDARASLWESPQSKTDDDDDGSDESEPGTPAFTDIVIDVWTDLRGAGTVGEPVDLQAEISAVERAIDACYKERPPAVKGWLQDVQNKTPAEKPSPKRSGFILAAGAGLFGSIFGGLINKLRR